MAGQHPVRVEVLGPLRVVRDGVVTRVTGRQRSMLLALLAARTGRVLSAETLTARAWPQGAPASAAAALRVHLAALRQLVDPGADVIPHGRGGYCLDPALVRTDLQDFDDLAAAVGPRATTADLERVDAALALLRGMPFAGLDADPELHIEAERIDQVRQRLEEDRLELRLELGQHAQVCAEAAALVAAAPLRERRTRQLMVALYRSGRQADALTAFRRLRDGLIEDLGLDPEASTRELELRILRQDPDLAARPSESGSGAVAARLDPPRAGDPPAEPTPNARSLLDRRSAGLSPRARSLVDLVAVLDEAASVQVVRGALDASVTQFDAALAEARAAGLVALSRDRRLVRLTRDDLREPVLHALSARRRAQVHAHAGRALAAYASVDPGVLVPAAWHLALAARSGARPAHGDELVVLHAMQHCLGAGQADAAEQLASEMVAAAGEATPARIDLMTGRVRALTMLGRAPEAHQQWERAVAAARAGGDPERLALAVLARDWAQRSAQIPAGGQTLLREALDGLGPRPSAVRVRVLSALLLELSVFAPAAGEVEALAGEVEAEARHVGDSESLCATTHVRHVLLRSTPRLDTRRALAAEFDGRAERTGDPWWRARATVARLSDAFAVGGYAAVPPLADRLKQCALDARAARLLWHHALVQSSLHRELGDFAAADRWSSEGMMQGAAAGVPDTLGAAVLHKVLMAMHLADLIAFRPQLVHFRSMQPDNPLASACLALSFAQSGEIAAARGPFAESLEQMAGGLSEIGTLSLGVLAEAAYVLGARSEAAGIRALLGPFEGLFLTFGQVSATLGPAARHLALLDRVEGDEDAALGRLEAAQESARRAGALPWEVRAAADRVTLLRERGATRAAATLAGEYAAAAHRLGLGPCLAVFDGQG